MDSVLQALPELSNTVKELVQRQSSLESQVLAVPAVARSLAQPLSAQVTPAVPKVPLVVKTIQPPPRTTQRQSLLNLPDAPEELQELETEKNAAGSSDLARAMLAQSAALITLVAHLTSSSQDPMADLQSSSSSGVRGSAGRARLQSELASHPLLRRCSSLDVKTDGSYGVGGSLTSSAVGSGISGARYLERYGGYGRQRDLGTVQYQVMTAFDFLITTERLGTPLLSQQFVWSEQSSTQGASK